MALDFPVGTDFPANGDQIPDGEIYEGFYWDAATGAWKRVCERDKIGDCLDDDADETVCDKLNEIERDIIELEEEIDAIATSRDRGTWEWAFSVNSYLDLLPAGQFYMVQESDLAVVTDYKDCGRIIFHEDDLDNDNHVFNTDLIDKVLMLFDRPDDDFIESVITNVEETTGATGKVYVFHVDRRQSEGSPTNAPDADGKYKARLNIFDQPSGGNAGEYVLKIGDTMSGTLQMGDSSTYPDSTNTDSPKITFEAKKSTGTTYTSELYGNTSGYLYSSRNFFSNGTIQSKSTSGFGYNGSTRMGFGTKSIDGSSSTTPYAYLGIGTGSDVRAMEWSGAKGLIWLKANSTTGSKGQVIKKDRTNNRPKWQGVVDISPSGTDRSVGELWYNANDQVLYVRVS